MPYKIGIICITTVGSTVCETEISKLGGAKGEYPRYAVDAIPVSDYFPLLFAKDWESFSDLVAESIENLPQSVDFVIIPSNTPHYAYDLIKAKSPKPVLDLIEITADECKIAGYKKVAILGTKLTMTGGLYQEKITARGIDLIIPPENICNELDSLIKEVLVPGKSITPDSPDAERFQRVLSLIKNTVKCDAFILGCTELTPFSEYLTSIDTTILLAKVSFNIAMEENHTLLLRYAHILEAQYQSPR